MPFPRPTKKLEKPRPGIQVGVILGLYRDNGKENGNYRDYRVYTGGYIGFILGEWKGK